MDVPIPATVNEENDGLASYYEACSLLSSISTNATADDLVGPGRVLGKLFSYAGGHLEKGLKTLIPKLRHVGQGHPNETNQRSDAGEEDADSTYRFEQCSLVESISTNATADNLPGHGHVLGLLYSAAGKRLELQVGRLAEKLGKGPCMTASRIQRRRSKMNHLPSDSKKMMNKNSKVKKDCEKLLKYARSGTTSTQIQALDQILSLAVGDPFIRNVLLSINATNYIKPLQTLALRSTSYSPTLLSSSRRALSSLTESEVIGLAEKIEAMLITPLQAWPTSQILKFKVYLQDSDRAFLVLRFLRRILDHSCSPDNAFDLTIVHEVLDFSSVSCYHFEWADFDHLISRHLEFLLEHGGFATGYLSKDFVPLIETVIRCAENLPKTLSSKFFAWLPSYETTGDMYLYSSWCLSRGIMMANGIEDSSVFRTRLELLKERYSHPSVQPILRRLFCPPELLLLDVFAIRYNLLESWGSSRTEVTRVIDVDHLVHVCRTLCRFLDRDGLFRERAIHALRYLLAADVYCRRVALNTLSESRFSCGINSMLLSDAIETQCTPRNDTLRTLTYATRILRHCDKDGKLLCLNDTHHGLTHEDPDPCYNVPEGSRHVLEFMSHDVQELVVRRGSAFSAKGYYPLVAGTAADGSVAYVALPVSENRYYHKYVAITEGTKPEDFIMWDRPLFASGKRLKVNPLYLIVYVLRYAPETYSHCDRFRGHHSSHQTGPDGAGPYTWRLWGDESDTDSDIMTPEQLLEWYEGDDDAS